MTLAPGDLLERYEILTILGEGGMGVVYRAYDTRLQRRVALKVLHPTSGEETNGDPAREARARMLREARAAALLEHPNIVAVYDVGEVTSNGESNATAYLAMELVEGRTLRSYVGDANVAIETRIHWLVEAVRALAHAHAAGIVHRDVKPENLMVRNDGTLKVLDFGIAKRTMRSERATTAGETAAPPTGQGLAVGTPAYMAPEQMFGQPVDGRADQFAWGVVAYELLAGVSPWGTSTHGAHLVASVLSLHPEPLSRRVPEIPPHVARTVERALSKSRDDRFPTMADLLHALDTVAANAPTESVALVRTSPAAGAEVVANTAEGARGPRPRRRSILLAALAIVALASTAASLMLRAHVPSPSRSSSATPLAARAPGCTHAAECPPFDGGMRCRTVDGVCAPLASVDCTPHASEQALGDDRTVWLGAMFPLKGHRGDAFGRASAQAADLARRDFDDVLGALEKTGEASPIGLVICDTSVDPARAAHHLVDVVGVPAILGFDDGAEARELASGLFAAKDVLAMAVLTTDPLVTRVPQRPGQARLVWRIAHNAENVARAAASLLEGTLESRARRAAQLPSSGALRVALLRDRSASSRALADVMVASLRFNGKSALDNGELYGDFPIAREARVQFAPDAADDTIARLVAFAPHIVVVFGGSDVLGLAIDALEPSVHPYYLGTFRPGPPAFARASRIEGLAPRVFGVNAVGARVVNAQFTAHYNDAFRDEPVTREASPSESYDAFYVLAYGAYAAGTAPLVTGQELSRALERLQPPGTPIDVGPGRIFDAYALLRAGKSIDLTGATGAIDLEPKTGEAPADIALMCLARDPQHAGESVGVESGVVYDAKSGTVHGELDCRH